MWYRQTDRITIKPFTNLGIDWFGTLAPLIFTDSIFPNQVCPEKVPMKGACLRIAIKQGSFLIFHIRFLFTPWTIYEGFHRFPSGFIPKALSG